MSVEIVPLDCCATSSFFALLFLGEILKDLCRVCFRISSEINSFSGISFFFFFLFCANGFA